MTESASAGRQIEVRFMLIKAKHWQWLRKIKLQKRREISRVDVECIWLQNCGIN